MNWLDLVIGVALVGAAIGGWRLGFLTRLFAWIGVAIGLAIGIHYVPRVVTAFGGTSADDRMTVAVLLLLLVACVGQALGLGIGLSTRHVLPLHRRLPAWDRVAGALLGVIGVLVLVWMIIPSLATAAGWPARAARSSWVVAAIDDWGPKQPATFAAWGRSVADAPYPSALGRLDAPPNPGTLPQADLRPGVDAAVRASVVKVTGRACHQIQEGSGWVNAPGFVVTNAHVVAGERETTVEDEAGNDHAADVVAFDPVRDVAVLSVPDLHAKPLSRSTGSVGTVGAVYGHPGGGALTASPARVGEEILAVGTDIYRTGTSRRHVYVLAARLAPGDSGGPLVDDNGRVIGVAFAIDPGSSGTSYALTNAEVTPMLGSTALSPVSTGACLVG